MSPKVVGTVTYYPELGSSFTQAGPGIYPAYYKSTTQNRSWQRGVFEFAVPTFQNWNIVSARLRFKRDGTWVAWTVPDDRHRLGAYTADLAITTGDYSIPVTPLYTFATNQHYTRANEQFDFDVTSLINQSRGKTLGFRVQLDLPDTYDAMASYSTGLQQIELVVETK